MDNFFVSKEYLEDAVTQSARNLVGKIMKRFEILDDKEAIKKEVKELIYENYRDLTSILKAFSYGVKFITPKKD